MGLINNRNPKGYRGRKKPKPSKQRCSYKHLNRSLYTETVGGSTETLLFLNQTLFISSVQ